MINQTPLVSISDMLTVLAPNQDFGVNVKFSGCSKTEVERRIIFESRKYIVEQLITWLKHRLQSNPSFRDQINVLLNWLEDIKFRGFYHICDLIQRKRLNIQLVAPARGVKGHDYYQGIIFPILEFCELQSFKN